MTNVYNLPPGKRRFRDASRWVTKLDRGLSADEEAELRRWLAAAAENRSALLVVAKQWDRLNELSRLADLLPDSAYRQRRLQRATRWAAAASILVALTAGVLAYVYLPQRQVTESALAATTNTFYETAVGEQSTVVLADGSRFVLNTNSKLGVRYNNVHRALTLHRGEIHIDVAPDPSRPLTVFANDKMVQALGTSFGVEIRDDDQIEVVVTEGKVLVAVKPVSPTGIAEHQTPVLPVSSLTVAQGEEVQLGERIDAAVRDVSLDEINVRLAWRDGDLVFRGEPLGEAMAEVSRYTTVEFVFLNDNVKQERIIGRFKAGDVDGFLEALRTNLSVAYERTEDGRVLLSSL